MKGINIEILITNVLREKGDQVGATIGKPTRIVASAWADFTVRAEVVGA